LVDKLQSPHPSATKGHNCQLALTN